jgi:methylmalonyl-CoA mutase N-terminal domain/subunit
MFDKAAVKQVLNSVEPWHEADSQKTQARLSERHAPFTRGIHPTGYRAKPWTMRMFVGFDLHDDQRPGGEYQEPVYF